MEANNHFNYGSHSVSSNSGLKLSSGDSPYTNGSSMSFPQQGKNINGEMNVNGVTTVIGSSVPGSHPPTAPYPHMSNHHHQGSMGYDYGLWAGQPQYSPTMSSPSGHGMHQKQPPPGVMQQQTQHHFQGHGQYQLNGGMGGSRQPPVAALPNVTLSGNQYWNRGNPGQQQMGYNSHGVYGAYQSQVHPGIAPSQHHQQQSLQSPPHQQTQQHLHHHPHHQHQQHQQQPQHYGMVPNGMPYYQHQPQHPPLPAPQPQAPPPPQPQTQSQMMPPTSQNFTPPRGSPQHHNLGRGGNGSPLPMGVSSVPMMSPSAVPDGGSPQSQTSERSPHGTNVGMPPVMQGRISEYKESDKSYNGMEMSSVSQRLPKCDSYPSQPPGPLTGPTSDYCQPVTQRLEVASSSRDPVMTAPPHSMSSPPSAVSAPPPVLVTSSVATTPPRVSASGPPQPSPGPPVVLSPVAVSTPPRNSTPPVVSSALSPSAPHRLSSPPLVVQGLRRSPVSGSQMSPTGSTHPSVVSPPSSVCASPTKSSAPPPLMEKASRPSTISTPHSLTALSSVTSMYSPSAVVSSFTTTSVPPLSVSAPISALQQMVQGSRPPPLTPCPPAVTGSSRERLGPPSVCGPLSSVTATSCRPPSTGSAPPSSVSAPHMSGPLTPLAVSMSPLSVRAPFDSVPTPPQALSPPLVSSQNAALTSSPKAVSFPPSTAYGPRTMPVSGPPPLTSPARVSPVSRPPSLMSALPPAVTAPLQAHISASSAPPTPQQCPKMSLLETERHGIRNKGGFSIGPIGGPGERMAQDEPERDMVMMSSKIDATEAQSKTHSSKYFPMTPQQSKSSPRSTGYVDRNPPTVFTETDTDLKQSLDDTCETGKSVDESFLAVSTCLNSTTMEDTSFTEKESTFYSSLDDTSRLDDPPGMNDTSGLDDDSCMDYSRFDDASRLDDDDSSRLDDTSCMDSVSQMDDASCTENRSQICDTTMYSSFSMVDSRDGVLDDTQADSSRAEETMDSCLSTKESMLESTVNNTSQIEDSQIESSQNEASLSSSFSPFKPAPGRREIDEEPEGRDIPDSAETINGNGIADAATVAPSSMVKKEALVALLVESPVVPLLLPTPADAPPPTGRKTKTPGKPRKPRAPSSSTPIPKVPGQVQRKPKTKSPKVDKVEKGKKKLEKEGLAEKEKGTGRKRKKSIKAEVTEPPGGITGEVVDGSFPGQEPIKTIVAASGETLPIVKPKKVKKAKKLEPKPAKIQKMETDTKTNEEDNDGDDSSTAGDTPRRRIATEEQVHFPLFHGWRREIRVKKTEDRLKGETWYYSPCGRRMKQFPEVIKYLNRHQDSLVTREHFSFSPRMPVGDFYEEKDTPEGVQWVLLANEEVPSMIMAITGRRGRPPNPDKEKPRSRVRRTKVGQVRRPGRPPKPKMVDLLSKVDARMLKKLEAKEALTDEDKEKLVKIKKKLKRKARMKRNEDAKNKKIKQEKKKAKLDKEKETKEPEGNAELVDQETPQAPQPTPQPAPDPKKPGRKKRVKAEVPVPVPETDQERLAQGKRVLGARSKAKALAKAQAEAEAAAQAALTAKRQAERRAQAQRRLEERKRQQMILDELKKPVEDMCLTDHQPLPELSRIPGLVLSGPAFSHCLTVVEFLHSYGKVLGLNIPSDVPSLSTLQEGLLGLGDSQGEVQDLLLKLVEAALHDPGLPPFYQSVKILGEKLVDLELTRSTVSEGARVFLEAHRFDTEVCTSLRTKTFHTLSPDTKAAILGFLVEELNGSNIVISEIDNTLENMATYRKNKWIIEGKLRKLKAALARRTGRSEEELCLEERRRSARVAEEENLSLEEGSPLERGSRRARKEEPKLSDSDSPSNATIPELERQIDKLTKRQVFFRKKLLQSSHSLRAVSLGQDRFRRRYWALPHLGGVLVEGPEEILVSEDILVADVPITLVKKEPKVEEKPTPITPPSSSPPPPAQSKTTSPEEDPLPGTASLMSSPRGRGRPRKIKPEVELHLRTAKIRRRRRSSKSGGEEGPAVTKDTNGTHDLTQAAFQNWLGQSQGAVTNGTSPTTGEPVEGRQAEDSVKEMAQKQGQWFNLLPKEPCDPNSLTEPQMPTSTSTSPKGPPQLPSHLPALAAPLLQSGPQLTGLNPDAPPNPQLDTIPPLQGDTTPPLTATPAPARPIRRRRRGSSPARRGGARGGAAKRRGRPPSTLFQEIEQQYFTQLVVKPIPASMVRGWWWIRDTEELALTLRAMHPRGIREKVLHKHLAKHMDYLTDMCTRTVNDPVFQVKVEEGDALLEALQQPWQVQERSLETDISALRWVEDLEQRVITADLHLKVAPQSGTDGNTETPAPVAGFQPYTAPEPDSTRDDLHYYEHDTDPRDDWIVRTKKEWSDLPRIATHPLDLAVLRLANLERNIDRRYLKEPLWNLAEVVRLAPLTPSPGEESHMDVMSLESEITPRLRTWRQALDRCRSAPQMCLCLLQLEKAIAWERSVVKVTCLLCRKGDNDEYLLLCDGCDRGCHMYCLRPKVTQVPEGDWFCPTCSSKEDDESQQTQRSSKQRTRVKKRRYEDGSSDEETAPRRGAGMTTRHKDGPPASSSSSRYSGDGGSGCSPAKRRRMTTRNQPDLTYCEIILMEMEAHADAWPFLEPVNPRLVPGYRRIIKTPMDFLTMRERLLQGGYCSCEEFAADAQLVFNNCELFNEDTSEVGMAGHSMRRFFENRWAEFYENKDK
ncbi:bromodomain adjacent to zinc finger domain protein 2A [Osmerus eperlanus]|uniref:bromodomain adjacent to zinc finger domain protein 2A n=1 Tax=Osmerus eperlanus TaxID=29151 RepID=UPI002E120191